MGITLSRGTTGDSEEQLEELFYTAKVLGTGDGRPNEAEFIAVSGTETFFDTGERGSKTGS